MDWISHLLTAAQLDARAAGALALVVFLAAIMRGYAGFGFSAALVAAGSMLLPVREVVPLALLLEITASAQMARGALPHVQWRLVAALMLGTLVMSPIGQMALRAADAPSMRAAAGALLLLAVALLAAGRRITLPSTPPAWVAAGAVSGFMNGLLAMGGLWAAVYMLYCGAQAAMVRASLTALFFATDIYAVSVGAATDLVDRRALARAALLLPFMALGVWCGSRRFATARQESYRPIALAILAALGAALTSIALFGDV